MIKDLKGKIGKLWHRSALAVLLLAAVFIAPSGAYAQLHISHARLIAQQVDETQRSPLNGATPLLAQQAVDKGKLSSSEPLQGMKLVLRRGAEEKAALRNFLDQVQNASSPNYHHWLTPEQFGQRFGANDEDIAAVSAWLISNGLTVDSVSKSHMSITFSGTEEQFESAFHTAMHRYELHGESRIANSSVPSTPTALAPAIVGIASLGNAVFRPMHTAPQLAKRNQNGDWLKFDLAVDKPQSGNAVKPQFTSSANGSTLLLVGPADFGEIYGVNSLWKKGIQGAGQSIAIVAESNVARSDIDAFRKAFGLPATKLNVIVLGNDPGLDSTGSEGEADLDVQWAGAMAPEATINLLVAGSTKTQSGIIIAAEYAIETNMSPILDVSWGACEMGLGESGNQFFDDLWSQAAAQGISVMVASGDAGSVACDQNQYYANYGQQVNGMASTEYATAVGGTDLYGNAEGASKYWTKSNDPVTLQSVKSYLTESTWNNSCVNPLILQHAADFGLSETTMGDICEKEVSFLNTVGGGGGISLCTTSDGSTQGSCKGGHPAPAWQQSIASIGATGKRHVPDVSLFSGSGLWGSAYAFCEADASSDSICNNNNGEMTALTAGGTSFAAPALAGIVALINQQQGARQGNINKYLYAIASKQLSDPKLAANCQSGSGADNSACIFHDVVIGSISEPCRAGTIVDPVKGVSCVATGSYNYYGATPGYAATVGYDVATGLGSINASQLAVNWVAATAQDAASQTTISISGATNVTYGSVVTAVVNVKAASGAQSPSGAVSVMSTESDGSTLALAAQSLSSGSAQLTFNTLPPGIHHLYAVYGGDAVFGASTSQPASFTVVKAATSLNAAASASTVLEPNSSTILIKVQTSSTALSPTGSVVFTNQTTGKVIGSGVLSALSDSNSGDSWALASFNISSSNLVAGNNTIAVSYTGDSNYLSATTQTLTIKYVTFYAVSAAIPSLEFDLGSSNTVSSTVTIASSHGGKVDPSILQMACQGITVSGLSCQFGVPVQNSDGSVSAAFTVTANNPAKAGSIAAVLPQRTPWVKGTSLAIVAGMMLLWTRRRAWSRKGYLVLFACFSMCVAVMSGCGGAHGAVSSPAVNNQLSLSSSAVSYGSSVTITATLTPVSNTATPGGTVVFYDGATPLGSAPVSGGVATMKISSLSAGTHSITASYSGDSNFMPSTSTKSSVKVTLATSINVQVSDTGGNVAFITLPVTLH